MGGISNTPGDGPNLGADAAGPPNLNIPVAADEAAAAAGAGLAAAGAAAGGTSNIPGEGPNLGAFADGPPNGTEDVGAAAGAGLVAAGAAANAPCPNPPAADAPLDGAGFEGAAENRTEPNIPENGISPGSGAAGGTLDAAELPHGGRAGSPAAAPAAEVALKGAGFEAGAELPPPFMFERAPEGEPNEKSPGPGGSAEGAAPPAIDG